MKIEVEIDEEKIQNEIVERLQERFFHQMSYQVDRTIKEDIRDVLKAKAREEVSAILKDFTLPDGRTFRQYVENLLWAPSRGTPPIEIPWADRPHLLRVIEERLWRESRALFEEIAQPALKELKEKLREKFIKDLLA